jgi:hypothetical protein
MGFNLLGDALRDVLDPRKTTSSLCSDRGSRLDRTARWQRRETASSRQSGTAWRVFSSRSGETVPTRTERLKVRLDSLPAASTSPAISPPRRDGSRPAASTCRSRTAADPALRAGRGRWPCRRGPAQLGGHGDRPRQGAAPEIGRGIPRRVTCASWSRRAPGLIHPTLRRVEARRITRRTPRQVGHSRIRSSS